MSVTIEPLESTVQSDGFSVTPVRFTFTDWRNFEGKAGATNPPSDATITAAARRRKGNRTMFYPNQAPSVPHAGTSKRRRMLRLNKHNRDLVWYRADVNLSAGADVDITIHMMRALGDQLEMNMRLVYRAISRLFSIDVPETGHPTAAIGFCLYVDLFNEATEAYENRTQPLYWKPSPGKGAVYYPSPDKDDNDRAFERVADSLIDFYPNVTTRVLQSILQRLQTNSLPTRSGESTKPMVGEILNF